MRVTSFESVQEMDHPDTNPDGSLYAWGTGKAGESLLWTFDPKQPPGQQERVTVIDDGPMCEGSVSE